MNVISVIISLLSMCVAATTAWWTIFRRGQLKMTTPSVVFFGFDDVPKVTAKVFLRCLLYSTSPRGQVVEAMYAKLGRTGSEQVFGFWGYGPRSELTPGSGLFVAQTGVALNHHFVLSVHQPPYEFVAGDYSVQVFARQVGRKAPLQLAAVKITVTADQARALAHRQGVLFELGPDTGTYSGHPRRKPGEPLDNAASLGENDG